MPLVFISIVTAFTKLKLTNNIGKISILIIGILIGTTAIAAAIGITTTLVFDLEAIELEEGDAETARNEVAIGRPRWRGITQVKRLLTGLPKTEIR